MAAKGQDEIMPSLQEIIKKRNIQINRALKESGEALRVQVEEGSTPASRRKGGATPETSEAEDDGSVGVLSIIADLMEKMGGYYDWSKKQAKIICWVAVGSCIAGALIIVAAFVLSILRLFSFEQTLVTAISGMITEVFSGTTLIVYRSSVKQLNYYHKSLHEDQRFLCAVDLSWRLSKDIERDKMLATIIKSALKINETVAAQPEVPEENDKPDKPDANGKNNGGSPAEPAPKK